jgi:hypothetical protein
LVIVSQSGRLWDDDAHRPQLVPAPFSTDPGFHARAGAKT